MNIELFYKLKAKAVALLAKKVEDELNVPDPSPEKAKAILNQSERGERSDPREG